MTVWGLVLASFMKIILTVGAWEMFGNLGFEILVFERSSRSFGWISVFLTSCLFFVGTKQLTLIIPPYTPPNRGGGEVV